MKNRAVVSYLSALAGAMILLAGCGGGGGGGSAAAPALARGGTFAGIAAKGLLANAVVTAYCGNNEAPADQLATGITNTAGQYSLSWTTACAGPILLVVTAGANTTMADEATGTLVTPPAGFQLRAFLADPATTTVKNITALTDMAVAIAGTSPTLSATAASNAESAIIATVLGGDIGAYQATPLPPTAAAMATASADEKKLATMLTAVSAFAQDGTTAAACGTLTDTAAKIQCAIGAFEAQAAATVTSVSDAGYTIATNVPANTPATMLAGTLAQITAEAASGITGGLVTATGPQALASTITADSSGSAVLLASASVSVLAAASTGGVVALAAAATGVQAASNLFNSLKTDLSSLTNSSGTGFLDQKVSAMTADFNSLAITSVTSSTKNIKALSRALQMANDAQTALWAIPGTAPNTVYPVPNSDVALETNSTGAPLRFVRSHGDGMNCYVNYADTTTSATLVSVAVTPAVASIPILGIQPFTLTAVYSDGSTLNVTAAPTTTWTSATTGVATVV